MVRCIILPCLDVIQVVIPRRQTPVISALLEKSITALASLATLFPLIQYFLLYLRDFNDASSSIIHTYVGLTYN